MEDFLTRTTALIGNENIEKLKSASVLIFGVGGVGGYVVEALSRAGVGNLILVDSDKVSISNINRQIIATNKTVGVLKTEAFVKRINEINPNCQVATYNLFVSKDNLEEISFNNVTFVVDCIDTISSKIEIIKKAQSLNIPVISCMGTGNKLDATAFKFSDINKTKVCPLCKVMRKLCKENGINSLKVLYSEEEPIKPVYKEQLQDTNKLPPASISYTPAVAGLLIAGEVIKTLINS